MSKRDAERNYFELKYLGFQENQPEEKSGTGPIPGIFSSLLKRLSRDGGCVTGRRGLQTPSLYSLESRYPVLYGGVCVAQRESLPLE